MSIFISTFYSQCPASFPATTAELDCDDASVIALSNNASISPGSQYGFCGSSENTTNFSGINLGGGTLRICGNATVSGTFNSGKIIVQCGATLMFNSGLSINRDIQIINYGTVKVNGDLTMQNQNNVFYNEGKDSRLLISGNLSVPQNTSQSVYWKNEGFIQVGGTLNAIEGMNFCLGNGSTIICDQFVYMNQCNNTNNRFSYSGSSGSAILRFKLRQL